ncbi:hypothetical protein [Dyadobacter sandarakinus]|uniref:Uncharacterized protein n=1 Tax=Dyadobacter sandarakinus TaxID=2747268 RepID=A0ABX7I4R6_9BACT|nr:hypothetical protein [Dyadobacter sandarakinus]QRR01099.1 hypothetical protein HWI92_09380 [Dyadobacter sandarakinus]
MNTSNELFSTSKGQSFQCDLTSRVIIQFGEMDIRLKIKDFLSFRRFINNIDIQSRLFDLSDESDYEFLEAPQLNICRRFTLCELIQLRDLLNGTQFAIELNSLLHQLAFCPAELV